MISSAVLLIGCIRSMDFSPTLVQQISIGTTTREQAQSLFGEAISDETALVGGLKSEILTYDYMKDHSYSDRYDRKYIYLEFVSNKLNGFVYSNSFEDESTDFNADLLDSLIVNKSTRDEIISLLGNKYSDLRLPSNLLKQPMVNGKIPPGATNSLLYTYLYYKHYKARYKLLAMFFNSRGASLTNTMLKTMSNDPANIFYIIPLPPNQSLKLTEPAVDDLIRAKQPATIGHDSPRADRLPSLRRFAAAA